MSIPIIQMSARRKIENPSRPVSLIVKFAHALSCWFQSTNTRGLVISIPLVKMPVFGNSTNQLEIFNPIVSFIAIDMMNYLGRVKVSPDVFFHYKAMLKNISVALNGRVILNSDDCVSFHSRDSTLPPKTFFASYDLFLKSVATFVRACFATILSEFPSHNLKSLTTYFADDFSILHIPIYYPTSRAIAILDNVV